MEVLHKNVYFGPNPHVDRGVIYFLLDLGKLKGFTLARLGPHFLSRLLAEVPGLSPLLSGQEEIKGIDYRGCSEENRGLASLIGVLAQQLQRDVGHMVDFGETRPADAEGQYRIFYGYDAPEVGLKAGQLAVRLFASLLSETVHIDTDVVDSFDKQGEFKDLRDCAAKWPRSISSSAIQCVAGRRHIPVTALDRWPAVAEGETPDPDKVDVLVLGQGTHARFIKGLQTQALSLEVTSALNDRWKLNQHLAANGIPVPPGDPEFSNLNSERRVLRSAMRVGFPVVLKPVTPTDGRVVFPAINDAEQLASAYTQLARYSRNVVLEKQIPGQAYRLLMVNGKLIAASRLLSAGDRPGRVEAIEDFTAETNREVVAAAAAAARVFDLYVAGIDLVTTDISQSLGSTGGAVIGVDASPSLGLHRLPGEERLPLAVAGRYLDFLFPPGSQSRVPAAAITGTNGKTTTCRMVAHILRCAGRHVGLSCTDGVYIDGVQIKEGVSSGISGAFNAFSDPSVDAAVLETSRGTLVKKGLAFDQCTVSACTNVANDHLGLDGIHTVDEMATLKRTVLERARDMAVLNADDERCMQMIPYLKAQRICLVSSNSQNIVVREQISQGGVAVVLESAGGKDRINIYDGVTSTPLLFVDEIPATWGGAALFNVENAMFAAAISMGMGVTLDTIGEALQGFATSLNSTPGRLNVYDELPFRVIIDHAHNVHGLKSLCNLLDQLEVSGRRILVMSARGDRSDDNIGDSASAVAGHFDYFICRDYTDLRGRTTGEVPRLLRASLVKQGVSKRQIEILPDFREAVGRSLSLAKGGDLLVILTIDSGKKAMDLLDNYRQTVCWK